MITLETLEQYKQTNIELKKVCKEYAKQNFDETWQNYCGFSICPNGFIAIEYSYNDIFDSIDENEINYGFQLVSPSNLVEFAKTLKL